MTGPTVMICSPGVAAAYKATLEGRDRRRVKREMNKAIKRSKKAVRK